MNTIQQVRLERTAQNPAQHMEANLYKNFKDMRRYVQSVQTAAASAVATPAEPEGITGKRVKTFYGHPSID